MNFMEKRHLALVSGPDAEGFLQGLLSIDISRLQETLGYALLLTPQGKFLHAFFIFRHEGGFVLDADARHASALWRQLSLYRLRSEVSITPLEDARVMHAPAGSEDGLFFADPRHPGLEGRAYHLSGAMATDGVITEEAWQAIRLELAIPEAYDDLLQEKSLPMEFRLDRLHAIDFRKGCYIGQEVTARSKHRAQLHKQIYALRLDGDIPFGAELTLGGKPAGTMLSGNGRHGIGMLRSEHADAAMDAASPLVWEGRQAMVSLAPWMKAAV
jgi:folate-binding protein YgfZ